jgi:hypothetical protein
MISVRSRYALAALMGVVSAGRKLRYSCHQLLPISVPSISPGPTLPTIRPYFGSPSMEVTAIYAGASYLLHVSAKNPTFPVKVSLLNGRPSVDRVGNRRRSPGGRNCSARPPMRPRSRASWLISAKPVSEYLSALLEARSFRWLRRGELCFGLCQHGAQRHGERDAW